MSKQMLDLAKCLREAAHYCTELSELEKHCNDIAGKLDSMARQCSAESVDAKLRGPRVDSPLEAIRKLVALFDDEGGLKASFEQIQTAVLNGSDILSHFAMTEPRFYIDHGMIHDRGTGKHVTTDGEPPFEDGIEETCDLLNGLAATQHGDKDAIIERLGMMVSQLHERIEQLRAPPQAAPTREEIAAIIDPSLYATIRKKSALEKADKIIAAFAQCQAVNVDVGPYKGPMTVDAGLLHALWCYGNLQPIKNVVYGHGTHMDCLIEADKLLYDRAVSLTRPQRSTPEKEA